MYIRSTSLLALTVLAVSVLTSCGEKKDDPGVPIVEKRPAPPALVPGISQNLTKSTKPAMVRLDRFGTVTNPAPQKPFQIAADSSPLIMGWAIDETAKKLAGGIEVVLDQNPYIARTGVSRTDVAEYYKQPDYTLSGFELTLPPGQFTKGEHSVSIRVISSDKKSYFQGDVLKFVVN